MCVTNASVGLLLEIIKHFKLSENQCTYAKHIKPTGFDDRSAVITDVLHHSKTLSSRVLNSHS